MTQVDVSVPSTSWFDLLCKIDDQSEDIFVSYENSSDKRNLSGATLPALLRRLTTVETTSQSQIWSFLLHLRLFVGPKHILNFLHKRFFLSLEEVEAYATSVREEIVNGRDFTSGSSDYDGDRELSADGTPTLSVLLEDKHVIGPQYYWLSSSSEIAKHDNDELARDILDYFPARNDSRRIELESYSSIKLAVLMFLETWLVHFTEDFMFSALEVSGISSPRSAASQRLSKMSSRGTGSSGMSTVAGGRNGGVGGGSSSSGDLRAVMTGGQGNNVGAAATPVIGRMMNDLVEFLRSIARCPYMELLGVVFESKQEEEATAAVKSPSSLSDLLVLPDSQFEKHFPCISKLLQVISDEDVIVEVLAAQELLQQQAAETTVDGEEGDFFENSVVIDHPQSPSGDNSGSDRAFRNSLRMSFFDKFGNSRLSEILEFEEEGDLDTIRASFRIDSGNHLSKNASTGTSGSMSRLDILDRILSTPLPSEARLSMIHNEEKEKFYLKIAVGDVTCTYTISTTLVSAMMAASMELRARMTPLAVTASQCLGYSDRKFQPATVVTVVSESTSRITFEQGEEVATTVASSEALENPSEASSKLDFTSSTLTSVDNTPPPISVALISKLTQCLQVMSERAISNVLIKYGSVAVMLSAVELQLAQQYVMSDCLQDIPVRVFASAIDRQILAYSDNRKNGLDRVANVLRDGQIAAEGMTGVPDPSYAGIVTEPPSPPPAAAIKKEKTEKRDYVNSLTTEKKVSPQSSSRESTFRRSILSWMGGKDKNNRGTDRASEAILSRSTRFKTLSSLFYECDEKSIAHNLTVRLHYMYCSIPLHEFCIDFSYGGKSKVLCPMLARLRSESERLQELFINEILIPTDVLTRAEVIIQIIKVGELLARLRSHHALMMIVFALQSHAVHRLKNTWAVVNARLPGRWDILQDLVGFGGQKLTTNFCSRQSKEGISQDMRENMFMSLPDMGLGSGSYPLMRCSEVFRDFDFQQLNAAALRLSEDGVRLSFMISATKPDDEVETESFGENGSTVSRKRGGVRPTRSRAGTDATQRPNNRSNSLFEPGTTQRAVMMAAGKRREAAMSQLALRNTTKCKNFPHSENVPNATSKMRRALSEGSMPIFQGGMSQVSQLPDHPDTRSSDTTGGVAVELNCSYDAKGANDGVTSAALTQPRLNSDSDPSTGRAVSYTYMSSEMAKLRDEIDMPQLPSHQPKHEGSITDDSTSNCGTFVSEDDGMLQQHHSSKRSFRQHSIRTSKSRSKKMIGIVRSDGFDEAGGLPKASKKPYLPFLNGILSRIIRLNEVPDFMKAKASGDSDGTGFLRVWSPGNSSTDPSMLMVNFGKLRSMSNLLMLIRSSQLTPYDLPISFEIQCFLGRTAVFRGDDAMWERSKILE